MPQLSRNRLPVLAGFLTGHCDFGKHMAKIGLQRNSDFRVYEAEDESLEDLTSNCTAITEIRAKYLAKNKGEIPFLESSCLLQFIKALRMVQRTPFAVRETIFR